MIRLLQWLIFGHVHKWKTISTGAIYGRTWNDKNDRVGTYCRQQCETCGKVIERNLM